MIDTTISHYRIVSVALSGLVGGIPLTIHANDEPWWMPQSLLPYSPFHSFLIPGIILFSGHRTVELLGAGADAAETAGLRVVGGAARLRLAGLAPCESSDVQNRDAGASLLRSGCAGADRVRDAIGTQAWWCDEVNANQIPGRPERKLDPASDTEELLMCRAGQLTN